MILFLFVSFLVVSTNVDGHQHLSRVFGGTNAPELTFPWMVSLRLNPSFHICGGTILSQSFILTAASCFVRLESFPGLFNIRTGIYDVNEQNVSTEQIRTIRQILIHPQYNPSTFVNNLAMIQLEKPLDFLENTISNIRLSTMNSFEDLDLLTIGWALLPNNTESSLSRPLQMTNISEILSCTRDQSIDPTTQLCASGSCPGDTGGPLMIFSQENNQFELIGITSFRNECLTEGLYTRTEPFNDWIQDIIENPPPLPTRPTIATVATSPAPTPAPDILGPPIPFICNKNLTCGCSEKPVIFRDEPPFPNISTRFQARIVGGENAEANSWPWIVQLRLFNIIHFCAGSLITDQWMLTAAHCISDTSTFTMHFGVHDERNSSPQVRTPAQIIVHPDYVRPPYYINDLALVKLNSSVNISSPATLTGLACLPAKENSGLNYPEVGSKLAVIGWGRLLANGPRPTILRQVRVDTIANNDSRCLGSIYNDEKQFCAMIDDGGKDACQGDSGGPIHKWMNDHWEQVGIVSYGRGCAMAQNPGIYTRLSVYYDWIQSVINPVQDETTNSLELTSIPAEQTVSQSFTDDNKSTSFSLNSIEPLITNEHQQTTRENGNNDTTGKPTDPTTKSTNEQTGRSTTTISSDPTSSSMSSSLKQSSVIKLIYSLLIFIFYFKL